jgi:hypothetical protein
VAVVHLLTWKTRRPSKTALPRLPLHPLTVNWASTKRTNTVSSTTICATSRLRLCRICPTVETALSTLLHPTQALLRGLLRNCRGVLLGTLRPWAIWLTGRKTTRARSTKSVRARRLRRKRRICSLVRKTFKCGRKSTTWPNEGSVEPRRLYPFSWIRRPARAERITCEWTSRATCRRRPRRWANNNNNNRSTTTTSNNTSSTSRDINSNSTSSNSITINMVIRPTSILSLSTIVGPVTKESKVSTIPTTPCIPCGTSTTCRQLHSSLRPTTATKVLPAGVQWIRIAGTWTFLPEATCMDTLATPVSMVTIPTIGYAISVAEDHRDRICHPCLFIFLRPCRRICR